MADNFDNVTDEQLAAFLDGNAGADESMHIISELGTDRELSEILSLSDEIDEEVRAERSRIVPMWALAAANPDNLCSFECETFILHHLDYDIDHWSLLETAKANNWVREDGTPLHHVGKLLELKGLHVKRRYDATPQDIAAALDDGRQVIAIVDKNVLEGSDESKSTAYHAIYITDVEDDGSILYLNLDTLLEDEIDKDDFLKAWQRSSCYMVGVSQTPAGYNPQPIRVDDIDLDADLEELTEAIAENAHDIWARARMDEGWTYGQKRDDALRQHPDLVPYAQLPESEKEYDRIMAMNTLRLVRRLGYNIVRSF